jgi:hypothetical protein
MTHGALTLEGGGSGIRRSGLAPANRGKTQDDQTPASNADQGQQSVQESSLLAGIDLHSKT